MKLKKCEICGKTREKGIRYLNGKKVCERCWYARKRKTSKAVGIKEFDKKWRKKG